MKERNLWASSQISSPEIKTQINKRFHLRAKQYQAANKDMLKRPPKSNKARMNNFRWLIQKESKPLKNGRGKVTSKSRRVIGSSLIKPSLIINQQRNLSSLWGRERLQEKTALKNKNRQGKSDVIMFEGQREATLDQHYNEEAVQNHEDKEIRVRICTKKKLPLRRARETKNNWCSTYLWRRRKI